jgi:undecaprenyl-diphosphatase
MVQSILERAVCVDTELFYILNSKVQNPVLDFLMPILTNLDYWRIPILLLAICLLAFGKKRGRIGVLLLVFGITLSDQLCNSVLKPLVGRMRPCNVLENVHLLVGCTKAFSFPSSHATNMFAAMSILSFVYPRLKLVLLGIAAIVSYSRVYVGVHYPFDVVAGIMLGVTCAVIIIVVYRLVATRFPGVSYGETVGKDKSPGDPR